MSETYDDQVAIAPPVTGVETIDEALAAAARVDQLPLADHAGHLGAAHAVVRSYLQFGATEATDEEV